MKTAVIIWVLLVQGSSNSAITQIGMYPDKVQCEADVKLVRKTFCLEKTRK